MDSPIAEVKISLNREKIGDLPTQKKSILKNAAKWSILLGAVTYVYMPLAVRGLVYYRMLNATLNIVVVTLSK